MQLHCSAVFVVVVVAVGYDCVMIYAAPRFDPAQLGRICASWDAGVVAAVVDFASVVAAAAVAAGAGVAFEGDCWLL